MKNNSLEGLRGIAALGVVLSHLLFSLFPYLANNTQPDLTIPQAHWWETYVMLPPLMIFINGSFSVSVFFVLSGYVLTTKFFETNDTRVLASGAIKRYPRLVIPAAASVMFAWVLLSMGAMNNNLIPILGSAGWPYGQYAQSVAFQEAVKAAFIGAPIFGDTALNSPLWTIRIELIGSLFLFAAYALAGTKRLSLTFLIFLGIALAANWGSINSIHYIALFAGSLLNRIAIPPRVSAYLIAVGLICGGFDYSGFYGWVPVMWGQEKLIVYNIGAFFLVAGTLGNPAFSRLLETKIPVFLGRISFSSYLIHWPIICSFGFGMIYILKYIAGFNHESAALSVLTLSLAVILLLSNYYEKYVDRPSTRLATKFANAVVRSKKQHPSLK